MKRTRGILISRRARLALAGALVAAALATWAHQRSAWACGGLFCNAPPPNPLTPLPVAQNGENVAFAITKDPAGGAPTIAAHIQILYTGDAAKFSWIVPVDAVPTLSTGTDYLFSQLASATRPSFNATYVTDGTCIDPPFQTFPNGGFATGSAGASGGAAGSGGGAPGVQIAFQGAVGPFDTAVVKSDDPTALKTWLTTNGYTVTDAASAIIDQYVREMKYFVALKLLNGMGTSSIQPIVLTFVGTEPCVPLRLTAIAANPDMPVLVWVLSDKRVAPRGFYEMTIDEARIDWWTGGASYFGPRGLVSQAADDAGGNAFITEYAGTSHLPNLRVVSGQIDLTPLRNAPIPPVYVQQLSALGIANDPLMLGLLQKYIPMPAAVMAMGVMPLQFYGNISFYWNMYAFPPYDLAGLTDAISTSIVTPRMNAQAMLDAHDYLTRLNTYLSPAEMNQDAFFFETTSLPDVSNVHTATIRTLCGNKEYMACNAPQRLELPDGRIVWLTAGVKSSNCQGQNYDVAPLASLPAAAVAYQRDVVGEGDRVVDNTQMINAGIDANNARVTKGLKVTSGNAGAPGFAGAGGAGFAGTGGSGFGGASGLGGAGGGAHLGGGSGGGCSCDVSESGGGLAALGIAAAVIIGARRRRRGCARG
jgi:MYXO-CTERM domain-containing protein